MLTNQRSLRQSVFSAEQCGVVDSGLRVLAERVLDVPNGIVNAHVTVRLSHDGLASTQSLQQGRFNNGLATLIGALSHLCHQSLDYGFLISSTLLNLW